MQRPPAVTLVVALEDQSFGLGAVAHCQDFFPNVLSCVLDVLHGLSDPRASGLVATSALGDIIRCRFNEVLQCFV